MWSGRETPEYAALGAHWRRWTEVVELFACRRRGRHGVDPGAYRALYLDLIESCRLVSAEADEPRRALCRDLENLVQPWLTVRALSRADRDLLSDLLDHCRRAQRELGGRVDAPAALRRAARVLVGPTVAAVLLLSAWFSRVFWLWALEDVQSWSVGVGLALQRSNANERLFLVGLVVIPAAVYTVSHVARS